MTTTGFALPSVDRGLRSGLGGLYGAQGCRREETSCRTQRRGASRRRAVIAMSGVHKAVKAKAIKETEIDPAADVLEHIEERHIHLRGADIAESVDNLGRDLIRPRSQAYAQVITGPYHKKMNMVRFLVANLAAEMTPTDVAKTIYAFSLMPLDPREDVWQELISRLEAEHDEVPDAQFIEAAVGMLRVRRYLTPSIYARFLNFPFRVLFGMPPVFKLVSPMDDAVVNGIIDSTPAQETVADKITDGGPNTNMVQDTGSAHRDIDSIDEHDRPERLTVSSVVRSRQNEYDDEVSARAPEIDLNVLRIPSEIVFNEYMFWTTAIPPRRKVTRKTAWQSEAAISLQYHDRKFEASPLTLTSKKLRRTLFEKTGIFFDSVLVQYLKHGGCGTGFPENWSLNDHRASFTDNVAITFIGCTRQVSVMSRVALSQEDGKDDSRLAFHVFEGDMFIMTSEGLEELNFRILPESKRYFADDSCSFTFFQSKKAAAMGSSLLDDALAIEVRSPEPADSDKIERYKETVDLSGLSIVRSVYTKQDDITFAYEPLTPSNRAEFKRSFGQIPDIVDTSTLTRDAGARPNLPADEHSNRDGEGRGTADDDDEGLDEFFG